MYENVLINTDTYRIFADYLLKERAIFICQEIDSEVAAYVVAALFFLNSKSQEEEISIYLNSCGGNVSDGFFAIYDAMMGVEAPIKTICIGQALSAAADILAAGTPGLRFAYPNSQIMIHDVQVDDMTGSKKEVKKEMERMLAMNQRALELLAKHTGHTVEKIEKDCEEDMYMTAKEAQSYGIVDEVIKPVKNGISAKKTKSKRKEKTRKSAKKTASKRVKNRN